jgi:flagellar basal-body rod protein FlgB
MQVLNLCKLGADVCVLRQQVIADNIANLNTPGFKRKYVKFESYLQHALYDKNKPIKFVLQNIKPKILIEADTFYRADKSNIDINEELIALTKNQILYQALIDRINDKFKALNSVITTRLPY